CSVQQQRELARGAQPRDVVHSAAPPPPPVRLPHDRRIIIKAACRFIHGTLARSRCRDVMHNLEWYEYFVNYHWIRAPAAAYVRRLRARKLEFIPSRDCRTRLGERMVSMSSMLVETVSINYEDFNESFLTCGTCLCVYDGSEHTPKLLPCSHTVCLHCLTRIAASQTREAGAFRCPICRELITIPRGGVPALPPSFLVNQLLDLMSRQRREVIPKCSIHVNQELLFCETCDTVFCSVCTGGNHAGTSPGCNEHTIIPFSIAIKQIFFITNVHSIAYTNRITILESTNQHAVAVIFKDSESRQGESCSPSTLACVGVVSRVQARELGKNVEDQQPRGVACATSRRPRHRSSISISISYT
ncbi:unnamed protein product, partial [Trichogramma brassicae]